MHGEPNDLGFRFNDVQYYTCEPVVCRVGQPEVDWVGMNRFNETFGFKPREDQLKGRDPDILIEQGGRLCYLSHGREKSRPSDEMVINMRNQNHGSVFRHGMVTFDIGAVSRGLTHELVRHGVGAAVSQSSTRYVNARELGFVVPRGIREMPRMVDSFVQLADRALHEYESWVRYLMKKDSLSSWAEFGIVMKRKEARGIARELLLIGLNQFMQMSFTCQAARNLLRLRGFVGADEQIRAFAVVSAEQIQDTWPVACSDVEIKEMIDLKPGVVLAEEV